MKKHLLMLSGLLLSAFGMGAQEIDITPVNFTFPADLEINKLIPDNIRAEAPANLTTSKGYVKNNFFGENPYEDGIIVLGGAFAHANANNRAAVIKGTSVYDFGGELGTALVINGQNSQLGAKLGAANLPTISVDQSGVLQVFWVLNDNALNELATIEDRKTVKISMELNAFCPNADGKLLISELSVKNDANGFASAANQDEPSIKANINSKDFLDDDSQWNMKKWLKYEMTAHTLNHPLWIKMQIEKEALNGAALLIRNIKVTFIDEDPTIGATSSWVEYDYEGPDVPDVPEKVYPPASELDPAVFTDLTPSYFKFYNHHIVPSETLIRYDMTADAGYGQFNMGTTHFISNNTDGGNNYFTAENLKDGNILLGGAYYPTANDRTPLKNAVTLYNFGGEIGNALILNGVNSNLSSAIQNKLGLEAAPAIAKLPQRKGANLVFYWVLDHVNMAKARAEGKDKVRVRLEMNAYNNDMTCAQPVVTSFYEQNEATGDIHGSDASILFNEFATKEDEWDPSHWMVYEFDIDNTEPASYLKLSISTGDATKGHDLDNGALLIRSVEVYAYSSATEASLRTLAATDANDNGRVWNVYDIEAEDYQAEATGIRIIPSVISEAPEATVTASISPSTANPAVTWTTDDTELVNLEQTGENTAVISAKTTGSAIAVIKATSVGTPSVSTSFNVRVGNNTVGVDSIDDDSVSFEVAGLNGEIVVSGLAAGTPVNVYSTSGALVAKTVANGAENHFAVTPGVYVVNCGMLSVKIAVK